MSRVLVTITYRYWIMIRIVLLRNLPICCTPIHCYPVSLSQHVLLLNQARWLTTSSAKACYMMIMLLRVYYTLTYQTTFRFLFQNRWHISNGESVFAFKKRTFPEQNIAQFSLKLRNRNWSDLLVCNDPEIAYTVFSNTITELFDTCFPLRTVELGYKARKPWLTEGSKRSIRRISSTTENKSLKLKSMGSFISNIVIN